MLSYNTDRAYNIPDSTRARHQVHGDVGQVEHQHRPRVLGAGGGDPGQVCGARGGRGPRAHRRRAPALTRAARARLLLLGAAAAVICHLSPRCRRPSSRSAYTRIFNLL